MPILGLTGAPIHIGNAGLPDIGVTELISNILGKTTNYQGGSELFGTPATAPINTYIPPTTSSTTQPSGSNPRVNVPNTAQPVPTPTPVPTPGAGSNNNDINAQIDSMYQPGMNLLNQQEALLGSQKQTALEGLTNQATDLKNTVNTQTKDLQTSLASQQQAIEEGKRSALAQALSDYAALQQQVQSRFGQGSGAGAFISDIQGSELLRNKSTIQKSYDASMSAILDKSTKIQQAAFDEANRIERELMTGKKQIEDEFQNRLIAISSDRSQMETAKAQQKMQLLQDTIARSRALADARTTALFNLQIWKETQGTLVQNQMNDLNNQYKQMLLEQQGNIQNATSEQPYSIMGGGTTQSPAQYTAYRNPYLRSTEDQNQNSGDIFDPSQYFA